MTKYAGLVDGLAEDTYHALPGLSSTGAKKILESGQIFQHYINNPQEPKAEFDEGSAAHTKILGVGAGIAIYPDCDGPSEYEWWEHEGTVLNIRGGLGTKLSADFEAKARENGLIPVKRVTARVVDKIAEAVLSNDTARALLEGGMPEVSMFATDPVTGVALRGRLDYLGKRITDLKTTAGKASESGFEKSVFDFGYHVQFGHYEYIYELITGETPPWLWVVVEKKAPYAVGIHVLGEDEQRMGRDWARLARERYAEYREAGRWPGYPTRNGGPIGIVRAPYWAIVEYENQFSRSAA